jgi:hypothetical protein
MEKVSKKYLFFLFVFFLFPLISRGQPVDVLWNNCINTDLPNGCLGTDYKTLCTNPDVQNGREPYYTTYTGPGGGAGGGAGGGGGPSQPNYITLQQDCSLQAQNKVCNQACEQLCRDPNVQSAENENNALHQEYLTCQNICHNPTVCEGQTYCSAYPPPSPPSPPSHLWCAETAGLTGWLNVGGWLKCIFEWIISLPLRIAVAVFVFFTAVFAMAAGLLCAYVHYLFSVIYPQLLLIAAWKVPEILSIVSEVRHFVIPLIFLALALVGLATILRIGEYEAKKTFFPLLIVSVLIFFSTPIVQGIVTLGNIGTGAILDATFKGKHMNLLGTLEILVSTIASEMSVLTYDGNFFECLFTQCTIKGVTKGPYIIPIILLMANSFLGAFFFILLLIFIVACLCIFVLRIAFIWILLIIAPVAFFTAAFRGSSELKAILPRFFNWEGWWESLLQWAFIGVFLGFFIFGAEKITALIMDFGGYLINPNLTSGAFLDFERATTTGGFHIATAGEELFKPSGGVAPAVLPMYLLAYVAAIGLLWWGVKETPGMAGEFAKKFYSFGAKIASLGALAVGVAAGVVTGGLLAPIATSAGAGIARISAWESAGTSRWLRGLKRIPGTIGKGFLKGFQLSHAGTERATEMMKLRLGERAPKEVPYYAEVMKRREKREKRMQEEIAKDPTVFLRERNYYYTDPDTHKKLRGGEALESYLRHASAEDLVKIKANNLSNPTLIQNIINNLRPEILVQAAPNMSHSQLTQLAQGFTTFLAQYGATPAYNNFVNGIGAIPAVKLRGYLRYANQYRGLPI